MSRIAYVNGRYLPQRAAAVHVEDRGYQFSDGVYEVCEVRGGCMIDQRRHVARLPIIELRGPSLPQVAVAKQILEHLEGAARDLGVRRLVLETGIYQAEAIGLYRRAGFRPIRCWGEYAESLTSVCFEKTIDGDS